MNNLLESMTIMQVNGVGSLAQVVKQIENIRCVGCSGSHNTNSCPPNTETIAFIRAVSVYW